MKNICISLFFFLNISFALPQTNVYHPFPDGGACWSVDKLTVGCQGYCGTFFYRMNGDTIINSIAYHKIYLDNGYISMYWNGNQMIPNYYLYYDPNYTLGLRQDSLQKKVWFNINGTDTLAYDFQNMNVGDTINTFSFG